jgi:hypothetical protein
LFPFKATEQISDAKRKGNRAKWKENKAIGSDKN